MISKYTFIFEIGWRDSETGCFKPYEYRKKSQMSINDARAYARRLSNTNIYKKLLIKCFSFNKL